MNAQHFDQATSSRSKSTFTTELSSAPLIGESGSQLAAEAERLVEKYRGALATAPRGSSRADVRSFFTTFYHVTPTDEQLHRLTQATP